MQNDSKEHANDGKKRKWSEKEHEDSTVAAQQRSHSPSGHRQNRPRRVPAATQGTTARDLSPSPSQQPSDNLKTQWRNKLNLSPPFNKQKLTRNEEAEFLELATIEDRMRRDGTEQFIVQEDTVEATDKQKVVYHLYGSGFAGDDTKESRVSRILSFLDDGPLGRMDIVRAQNLDSSGQAEHLELWQKTQTAVILYGKQDSAFTIFDTKKIPLVLRIQGSTTSYSHAPSAAVSYKAAFGREDNEYKAEALDVSKLTRHSFLDKMLERRVVDNKGGSSHKMIKDLIADSTLQTAIYCFERIGFPAIADGLDVHGPALLRCFEVTEFFKTSSKTEPPQDDGNIRIHQFDRVGEEDTHNFFSLGGVTEEVKELVRTIERENGIGLSFGNPSTNHEDLPDAVSSSLSSDTSEPNNSGSVSSEHSDEEDGFTDEGEGERQRRGLHAMVLIGKRQEGMGRNKKLWFLVQNTWAKMPIRGVGVVFRASHCRWRWGCLPQG